MNLKSSLLGAARAPRWLVGDSLQDDLASWELPKKAWLGTFKANGMPKVLNIFISLFSQRIKTIQTIKIASGLAPCTAVTKTLSIHGVGCC